MKKIFCRTLSLIIVTTVVATSLFSCEKGGPEDTGSSSLESDEPSPVSTESDTEPWEELLSGGEPVYTIVRADENLTAANLANFLSECLRTATGTVFSVESDIMRKWDTSDRFEILVGSTNRPESSEAAGGLSADKRSGISRSGNKIVISGLDEASLADGVEAFLLEYTGLEFNAGFVPRETAATAVPARRDPVNAVIPEGCPTGDQTGRPENSAPSVDVEKLLLTDPSFDYSQDYAVRYSGSASASGIPADRIETGLIENRYGTPYNVIADFNVLSFGAAGDGVSDDTAAFKKAIEAANEAGGGTVFAPRGFYCLTEPLELPALVTLSGEIKSGTADGTVLCIYHGKGVTDRKRAAVICGPYTSVQNLAFWYPEQTIVNGRAIPYPASVMQKYINGCTVRNVTFVNSYIGIDASEYGAVLALQYISDVCGTCLETGFCNDYNLDIGKVENFSLSPDYWLSSGLPGTPNAELLRTYMLRNSTGILMGHADWFYFSDITISGYFRGFCFTESSNIPNDTSVANGQILNPVITDCYYPIFVKNVSWFMVTGGELRATGNGGAAALFFRPETGTLRENQRGSLHFAGTVIDSAGKSAIILQSIKPQLIFDSCSVSSASGEIFGRTSGGRISAVNTSFSGDCRENDSVVNTDKAQAVPSFDMASCTKETKPGSDAFIDLSKAPYNAKSGEDIGDILQKAIDELASSSGGTVYLPAGVYYVRRHIDLRAGVELRGSTMAAHVDIYMKPAASGQAWSEGGTNPFLPCGTVIFTDFGTNDPDGKEFISMYEGSGLCGLSIEYDSQSSTSIKPTSFTVRGHGKNIYVIDVGMTSSYNCIDFSAEKCDGHYVEFLWAVGLNEGIRVGAGSEGGIIRDCHFTVNCWQPGRYIDSKYWDHVAAKAVDTGKTYIIGESTGEILYNNFTINQRIGVSLLDGAKEVVLAGTAVDYSDCDFYLEGNCTATIINAQLVSQRSDSNYRYGASIYTSNSFIGKASIYNMTCWGNPLYTMIINGNGNVYVSIADASNKIPFINLQGGNAVIAASVGTRSSNYEVAGSENAGQLLVIGLWPSNRISIRSGLPKDKVTVIK